jgi:uncharacterized protein (DUF1499 family)
MPARTGVALARIALAVGLVCAALALASGPGYRSGWLSLGSAFMVLRWSTFGAIAGFVAGLLAWALLARQRRANGNANGLAIAVWATVLNLAVAAPPLYLFAQATRLPPIHDISTDTANPPDFVAVLPLRRDAPNPVAYLSDTAAQQKRGYPDLAPQRLNLAPAQAFERAERTARAMGWQIVAAEPQALRIEATDTTLFFGFKDDIVIRVRPDAQGSIVDVRSLSRIGASDVGANAKRVRRFQKKLAED